MNSDPTMRGWLEGVRGVLEATGLRLSPAPFSVASTPKTLVDSSFCLDLQTSDTGKYREGDEIARLSHTLTVRFAKLIKPLDQFASQLDGLDLEEKVIAALMTRSNIPDTAVTYVSTARTLTNAREHMLTDIVFRCELDWAWAQVA